MMNRRGRDLRLHRQSAQWYQTDETRSHPAFKTPPDYHESHYTRMLIEGMRNGIMPYSGMSKWQLRAYIEPDDPAAEDLIEGAVSRRGYRGRLYETVASFAHDCAAWMMGYGKAVYELAYLYDAEEKPVAFTLLHILPNSIKAESGRTIQHVPESVRRNLGLPSAIIELTPEDIVTFELPAYMRDEYGPMMAALYAQGSLASMPNFVLPSMRGEIGPVPFELSKFIRDQKMAVAEATKLIGWNARDVPNDEFKTEYYDLHRFLLFERFKLEVRNSILAILNEAIARAGVKLSFTGRIVVEGLPKMSDIQEAQQALAAGTKKFGDVIKPFLSYS